MFTLLLALAGTGAAGQSRIIKEAAPAWLIMPSVAVQQSAGDMEQRFGTNFTAGLAGGYKTASNWVFALDGQFIFSENVKGIDQLLGPVMTGGGQVLSETGNYASVAVVQRGFYFSGEVSHSFGFWQANPNSGPDLQLGAGYLQHWISIASAGNEVPQIRGDYLRGYDERTGGFMLRQSVGYRFLAPRKRLNFRLSFEIVEAFTENYRGFSYSSGQPVSGRRLDLLYGVRLQWMLPIYQRDSDSFYYD